MSAPVIGLTTYREQARWGVWDQPADLLPTAYAAAVEATGGLAVLLPPLDQVGAADAVVGRLDGLVMTGGADVDPARYGAEPHARTAGWRPERDAWELALLDAAGAAGLPVLGVCRGMQLMAVHAGGALDQHTPDLVGHEEHSPGGDAFGRTAVRTVPGTLVAGLVGERLDVACHHHQSVATHPGWVAAARAEDGTLEAMEVPGDRFCVAVQWHPETAADVGLLAGLVRAAASYAAGRDA
ncbi:gamma-glutamyl-gamma-aminobutyrate hydrolase family protein [Nocardioides sp. zg-579]|uniref:Gamma-glutamyl-gamma-aminobutyrate hydrolase family protein n=1 Tax=Nocardioides marmotae TaxID=2663857 RepID=A0A6I3J885_9ACTN|nr:gamma-glutamyl-gamma-aminobutyrate hydrolase family protein [Nocardioides marmotae]MCR6030962.1 gamma-glutamyl-gamma-aminobutyrate hydrolase family protein [Gordonia jinghuaiqii]MTB94599.1 gamma-glutamyl-gamma-aminobutyrate hydrolase family protein [Nocardioides marmotae]QKE01391.1 gamma-glutamyl-gamma-aminobutyrate hydrolase family protein [Nocardioides marmotae]